MGVCCRGRVVRGKGSLQVLFKVCDGVVDFKGQCK